ncbi:hypothetical protein WDV94_04820 [Clavibacter tessellarius]
MPDLLSADTTMGPVTLLVRDLDATDRVLPRRRRPRPPRRGPGSATLGRGAPPP